MKEGKPSGGINLLVFLLYACIYAVAFFAVLSIRWLGYLRGAIVIAVAVVLLSWVMGVILRARGEIPNAGFPAMMWEGFKALVRPKKPNSGG